MNELEQMLLHEAAGGKEPRLTLCTRTRIDTGRWWRATPVWLCVMENELLMLAVSRRQYLERIALADCSDTHYHAGSGELVIAPAEGLRFSRFRMSPREALDVLGVMKTNQAGREAPKERDIPAQVNAPGPLTSDN